jgi:hypothetical protein
MLKGTANASTKPAVPFFLLLLLAPQRASSLCSQSTWLELWIQRFELVLTRNKIRRW